MVRINRPDVLDVLHSVEEERTEDYYQELNPSDDYTILFEYDSDPELRDSPYEGGTLEISVIIDGFEADEAPNRGLDYNDEVEELIAELEGTVRETLNVDSRAELRFESHISGYYARVLISHCPPLEEDEE